MSDRLHGTATINHLVECSSAEVDRVAASVQHPEHEYAILVEAVEDAIRELAHPRPSHAGEAVDRWGAVREHDESIHRTIELVKEAPSELLVDRVVVLVGRGQVIDGELSEPKGHCSVRS